MNQFAQSELIGRSKAFNLFPNYQLVESSDSYAVWDLSGFTTTVAGDNKDFFIEVKDRSISSDDYNSVFMEFTKYQHLLKVSEENNDAEIFYLSFFSNGVAYIYNLKKLKVCELKLSVQTVNKTTVATSHKVDKIMIELPYHKARKYNLN